MILEVLNIDWSPFIKFTEFLQNDFSFSNTLGTGQSRLSLNVEYKKMDLHWKICRFHVDNQLVYWGIIEEELYNLTGSTTIRIQGWFSMLYRLSTRNIWGDIEGAVVNTLIENYNERIGFPILTKDIDQGDNYSITYSSYVKWTQVISDVVKKSGFDFYIWADQVVRFKEKLSDTVHKLSIWNEIQSGNIGINIREYVSRSSWVSTSTTYSTGTIIWDYEDIYWVSESNNESSDGSTVVLRTTLNNIKAPQKYCTLVVRKDIWKYQVWDRVTILNSPIEIKEVKILKIDFSRYSATLYLDDFKSIWKNL